MANGNLADLFRAETEIPIKASELFGVIRAAAKGELIQNAVNCEVPYRYIRETATGEKEPEALTEKRPDVLEADPEPGSGQQDNATPDPGTPRKWQQDGLKIVRTCEQGAEWIDIQDIIRKGRAAVSIPVGTEIHFKLKNGESVVVAVAAVNHYSERDAVFHFRRIVARRPMNENGTNAGGWKGCDARRWLNEEFIKLLPDELVEVMAWHNTDQILADGKTVTAKDKLFLPSEYEGDDGVNDYAEYNGIDKPLPLFEERIKRIIADDDGDPMWWWLADPSAAGATYFCIFAHDGASYANGASTEGGIAPLFVIR